MVRLFVENKRNGLLAEDTQSGHKDNINMIFDTRMRVSIEHQPEIAKKTWVERVDAKLRDGGTVFAKVFDLLSSKKGVEYLHSREKRFLDVLVSVPAAMIATPFIVMLGIAKRMEDGGTMFFIQERYDTIPDTITEDSDENPNGNKAGNKETEGGVMRVVKIRTMEEGAEAIANQDPNFTKGKHAGEDPRETKFGSVMRKYNLDELPQLWQVVVGQMSAIGVRSMAPHAWEQFKEAVANKDITRDMQMCYNKNPKKGVAGVHQILAGSIKEERKRYHHETWYTKNANLGLDLYLLWRTFAYLAKIDTDIRNKKGNRKKKQKA